MNKLIKLQFLLLLSALSTLIACSHKLPLDKPSTNWAMWGGNYAGTRYSELNEINASNIHKLSLAWAFPTKATGGHEGGPLVVNDIIYIHTPFPNHVYALDQQTQKIIWKYTPIQNADETVPMMMWDTANRGLAYAEGKIFLQQTNTVLTALDAKTGQQLWSTKNGEPKQGMTNTNAPIVVKNKVITGISGGEFGVRGFLAAYDINSGGLLWKGYSTGADKDTLIEAGKTTTWRKGKVTALTKDESLASWEKDQWKIGGGTTWGWYSYDPDLNLIYYGSGNPGTWNPVQRPGDNKWTAALWARNANTGQVKWVYQMTPHDEWDFDGTHESVLIDQKIKGIKRKTLVHFDKNGFAYTLDRETGELLLAKKYDASVNWATHIEMFSGRPQRVKKYSPEHQGEDVVTIGICPSTAGSKGQNPVSYSPKTGLFYISGNRECMDLEPFEVSYTAGQPLVGATRFLYSAEVDRSRGLPTQPGNLGVFSAWDAKKGQTVWSITEPLNVFSGSLATAGGIVFYGTFDGYLKAVNAKTGELLYQFETPSGIIGNINTWQYQGKQYIGVLSGVGGINKYQVNYSSSAVSVFSVFALPDEQANINFIQSYPREVFQLKTKNNPKFSAEWQEKFNPEIISTEVHKWISQIHYVGGVVESQGFSNNNVQDKNFLALKGAATQDELVELTQHPSPAVRFYAFLALTDRENLNLEPILIEHINDNEDVSLQIGCEVLSSSIGDLLIRSADPESNFFNKRARMNKLTPTQFQTLSKSLITLDSKLEITDKVLTNIEPIPELYSKIRSLVIDNNNQAALVALAKYQKQQDVELILNSSGKGNNEKEGFVYTSLAISHFPHPDFFQFIKNHALTKRSIESYPYRQRKRVLKTLYAAIASYQNNAAFKLMSFSLNNKFKALHYPYILSAISQFKNPRYSSLMWTLWDKKNLSSEDIFFYLLEQDSTRTVNLLKKSFQKIINTPEEKLYDSFMQKKNFINTMFNYAIKKQHAFAIQLVKSNIENRKEFFTFFIQKAEEIKHSEFIEPLFSQLKIEPLYFDLAIAKALFAYDNKQINTRLLKAIETMPMYNKEIQRIDFKKLLTKKLSL